MIANISKYDGELKAYVEEVLGKARLKKGSKMIEQGLSVAKVAELLDVTQWDLMSYLGKTKIIDAITLDKVVKSRLQTARKLFK
jgi:predicted transcriptional regulator